jgi:uncharacterized protein
MTGNKSMSSSLSRLPLVIAAAVALFLSIATALPAASQEVSPEQLALARKYVDLTDHSGLYEAEVVQAGFNTRAQLLPQNPKISAQIDEAIGKVIASYKDRKGEMFDQIARVYAIVFTTEELQQIVDFYSSPTGQKLSKANAELNSTIQSVVSIFRVNLNSEFLPKVRAELKSMGIDS